MRQIRGNGFMARCLYEAEGREISAHCELLFGSPRYLQCRLERPLKPRQMAVIRVAPLHEPGGASLVPEPFSVSVRLKEYRVSGHQYECWFDIEAAKDFIHHPYYQFLKRLHPMEFDHPAQDSILKAA